MTAPTTFEDATVRMNALRALGLFSASPDERFDRLTRLARRAFRVPIAKVTLVAPEQVHTISCAGGPAGPTSRDLSFCTHAIQSNDITVVPDTRLDKRFAENPFVTGEPHVRFYAGCPLILSNGCRLGTLCLVDVEPRAFSEEDFVLLRDLANTVEQELKAMQLAIVDELTGLANRRGFESLSQQALSLCRRTNRHAALLSFDLNGFKDINDTYGHAEGDRAIRSFAETLRRTFRASDIVGRLGGDEFVVLLLDSSPDQTNMAIQRLLDEVSKVNTCDCRGYDVCFSFGRVDYDGVEQLDIHQLLSKCDEKMYANKREFKEMLANQMIGLAGV